MWPVRHRGRRFRIPKVPRRRCFHQFSLSGSATISTWCTGPFTLAPKDHQTIADGDTVTLTSGGDRAEVALLANFQDFTPSATTIYKHSDPYAITFDPNSREYVYVVDAGQDAIVRISRETGRMRTMLRIPPIPSSAPGPPVSDPVPNAITPYGNQLLVTQLTGFPFTTGASRVSLFDPRTRN